MPEARRWVAYALAPRRSRCRRSRTPPALWTPAAGPSTFARPRLQGRWTSARLDAQLAQLSKQAFLLAAFVLGLLLRLPGLLLRLPDLLLRLPKLAAGFFQIAQEIGGQRQQFAAIPEAHP